MRSLGLGVPSLFVCAFFSAGIAACAPAGAGGETDASTPPPPAADAAVATPDAPPPEGPPYADFPAAPVVDTGAPADAPALFGAAGAASGGPCLVEPELGALFPNNWLRPRFSLVAGPGQTLFELRLHTTAQTNDLVVYSTSGLWTMPAAMWSALAAHQGDAPIEVTVRGAAWNGTSLTSPPQTGSKGTIRVAPVGASGAIVYWTTSGGTALKGFSVGAETVREVLRPAQTSALCIGCHSSTPDGLFVGFSASESDWSGEPSRVDLRAVDGSATEPTFLTPTASTLLTRQRQQAPVFTKAHWSSGDHLALDLYEVGGVTSIAWTDLEATSSTEGVGWGVLARNGDPRPNAAGAAWSHDGQTIAYVSTTVISSGVANSSGDLYTVPFADGAGGTATPLPGAADPAMNEFYPSWAADDRLLAFSRVPDDGSTTSGWTSYDNAKSEVFVIPPAGGQAVRLAANDPVMCTSRVSPGVTNSWPKWSPRVEEQGGKRYYWLTFSSTRGAGAKPQIYVTAVVVEGTTITTYPAIYLWNQPAAEANHTPAWDVYQIQ
jgi:hypothetical protein